MLCQFLSKGLLITSKSVVLADANYQILLSPVARLKFSYVRNFRLVYNIVKPKQKNLFENLLEASIFNRKLWFWWAEFPAAGIFMETSE